MGKILSDLTQVLELEARALLDCLKRWNDPITGKTIESIIEVLNQTLSSGGKIIVTGVGKSGKIAQKIAATLSSTGSLALYLHPTEGLHGDMGMVCPGDCVIALSANGNSEEILALVPSFRSRKVTLIAITGNLKSRLAQNSHWVIDASVAQEACPYNLAPTTSSTLALAIGDAIAISLMKLRNFKPEDFALNHPGGVLGKRLNLQVVDLMIPLEKTAVLNENDSMDAVIDASTRFKQGCVLILESGQLKGIITDGDLRRALKNKERFFSLKAYEIMTKNPCVIRSNELAIEALRLMENRPSQISVLPVIDSNGAPIGLIRLHDLVGQI
jgi:arabinose-5-phosphate isomerase